MTEYNIGSVEQVPLGEGREFEIGGRRIAVFRMRVTGEVYATQATCPHRAGPLADGLTGNGILVCPLHSWKFDLRNGLPILGDCGIAVYPVRLSSEGEILVDLSGSGETAADTVPPCAVAAAV